MRVDISRVNLLEKDIEDWLYENPGALYAPRENNAIVEWIGRQYSLPSGIADLIGVREDGMLVVVEVKNVPINKAAVLQVCRYTEDLRHIITQRMDYPFVSLSGEPHIDMILVGPSVDSQTMTEADAVNARIFCFLASVEIDIGCQVWSREYTDNLYAQRVEIAARPEWDRYGLTMTEDLNRYFEEKHKEVPIDEPNDSVSGEVDY